MLSEARLSSVTPTYFQPSPERIDATADVHGLLAGKTLLVTGAGRNIGRAIALEAAAQGAAIIHTDVDAKSSAALQAELELYPGEHRGFVQDIVDKQVGTELMLALQDEGRVIDILVNNVGVGSKVANNGFLDPEAWQTVFTTNVFGPLHLTELVVAQMRAHYTRGTILFVTSVHQWVLGQWPGYAASKSALGMLVRELAVDLSKDGIRVNGVAPGWVKLDEKGNLRPYRYAPLYKTSIDPRYVGRAAVYLAADYFSLFTTGTILKVDAGLSLYGHRVEQVTSR